MTTEEKLLARKLFQLEVYKNNGQAYENFFIKVIQHHNSNITPVKPQGQYGDRKNDGFDKMTGVYYQIYAPEDLTKKEKETIEKLVEDFEGLYKYWNDQVTPIKEFHYVLNDKYNGAYPSVYTELRKIEEKYPGVKCSTFLSKSLEDIFMGLSKDQASDIVGFIPSMNIEMISANELNDVITYLLSNADSYSPEAIPKNPNFSDKIAFNNISPEVSSFLTYGTYQHHILKEYFKFNSDFLKEQLRNKFNDLYRRARETIESEENKSDLVFFEILKSASPNNKKNIQDAVCVLMSYYFEYCDIFETPTVPEQTKLFE